MVTIAANPRATPSAQVVAPGGSSTVPLVVPTTGLNLSVAPGAFPVPGLGFDFTHHSIVNANLGVRALIDPVTQHQLALAREIRRETPVAFPVMPLVVNSIQVIVVPPPPVVIIQSPAPAEQHEEAAAEARSVAPAPVAPAPPSEPYRQASEMILVRRDGSLLFVVAFLTRGENLVYVTADGNRRLLRLTELDREATLEMNEARGTSLRLPS